MPKSFNEETGLRTKNFDPLAYIENAFLDHPHGDETLEDADGVAFGVEIPSIGDYIGDRVRAPRAVPDPLLPKTKFRKTVMSAPRPRRASQQTPAISKSKIDPELQSVWIALPKSVEFLCGFYDDSVTANYYRGEFKETRQDLIRRLLDPELSLEETSRLLGVCPATVRRYTNRGWLAHHRTTGGQRRFRLSDIVRFVDEHGRFPEE
jgi:excisionase family DNA binding protein